MTGSRRTLTPEELTEAAMAYAAAQTDEERLRWIADFGGRLISTALQTQRDLRRFQRSHRALQNVGTAGAAYLREISEVVEEARRAHIRNPKTGIDAPTRVKITTLGKARAGVVLGQLAVAQATLGCDDEEEIRAQVLVNVKEYLGANATAANIAEMDTSVPEGVN